MARIVTAVLADAMTAVLYSRSERRADIFLKLAGHYGFPGLRRATKSRLHGLNAGKSVDKETASTSFDDDHTRQSSHDSGETGGENLEIICGKY
jgi:hypothetical protein